MTIRGYLAGASAAAILLCGATAFAQTGSTSGPATGSNVTPSTAVSPNPAGAPGVPGKPGTEAGPSPAQPGVSGTQAAQTQQPGQSGVLTVRELTQELERAGFSDVEVVQQAFVVRAKTKTGNSIVMSIGPSAAFEASASQPATTGATGMPRTNPQQ